MEPLSIHEQSGGKLFKDSERGKGETKSSLLGKAEGSNV
jgi:hypothetical protein